MHLPKKKKKRSWITPSHHSFYDFLEKNPARLVWPLSAGLPFAPVVAIARLGAAGGEGGGAEGFAFLAAGGLVFSSLSSSSSSSSGVAFALDVRAFGLGFGLDLDEAVDSSESLGKKRKALEER